MPCVCLGPFTERRYITHLGTGRTYTAHIYIYVQTDIQTYARRPTTLFLVPVTGKQTTLPILFFIRSGSVSVTSVCIARRGSQHTKQRIPCLSSQLLSLSLSPTHTHNGRNRDVRHSTLDWVTRSQTGGRDRSTHESLEIVLIFPLTHNPLNLDEAKCVKTT